MSGPSVAVIIPSIPSRGGYLAEAIASVHRQTYPVRDLVIAFDHDKEGASATRNRGVRAALAAKPDYVAYLDDDDFVLAHHIEHLVNCAQEHDAGLVWSWMEVLGGTVPWPEYQGRPYDPDAPHVVAITHLIRADLLAEAFDQGIGFRDDDTGSWLAQDEAVFSWLARNTKTYASPEVSWVWRHWGTGTADTPGNTSGLASRRP